MGKLISLIGILLYGLLLASSQNLGSLAVIEASILTFWVPVRVPVLCVCVCGFVRLLKQSFWPFAFHFVNNAGNNDGYVKSKIEKITKKSQSKKKQKNNKIKNNKKIKWKNWWARFNVMVGASAYWKIRRTSMKI